MSEHPSTKTTSGKPDVDLTGRRLGDYQLLRRLGRGGMAEVWLAEQTTLRRQVAVKVLKSELAVDDTYVKRFQVEAQAAASLTHANIVQIHDVGCIDGVRYIAQEYVQGQNLREYLVRHGPPDLKQSLAVIRQVAAALYKASESGIIHRDIKPDNIMLARSGEVKVADFGLARVNNDGEGLNLTRVGMTMGTPLYMSPEQVEGKPLDAASDVYSFGVTCYHMLAGTPPFRGETALSVAVQHLKSRPEPLETVRPDLPPGLCRIVHKMLAKEPTQRYANCREVLRDLRSLKLDAGDDWTDLDLDFGAAPPHELDSATQRLGSLMRTEALMIPKRRPWIKWLVVLLIAGGLGATAGWMFRDEPLLGGANPHKTEITKSPNVEEQFFLAMRLNSEQGWRSVLEHYPEKEYYVRRASQQLARLHLRNSEYDEALHLFDELANHVESDADFRAFGLAGKCVVHLLADRPEQASTALIELTPIHSQLSDAQLRETLFRLLDSHRSDLTPEAQASFDRLRNELPPFS